MAPAVFYCLLNKTRLMIPPQRSDNCGDSPQGKKKAAAKAEMSRKSS